MEMLAHSISPVTFGMAGVIYTAQPRRESPGDESWLARAFRMTPQTAWTEWRSEDMTVVTAHHGPESHLVPGRDQRAVPTVGGLEGVVFGHFFGLTDEAHRRLDRIAEGVLHAYGSQGPTGLRRTNGAWAAALWDRTRQQAHLVRDSVGTHPMYAARLPGRIVFSTDLRVFRINGMFPELDEDALAQFLHYLYIPPPLTMNRGCHAVHAGHVLTMGSGVSQEKYAEERFVERPLRQSSPIDEEIAERLPEFEDRLLTAVAECLPPTGRVAVSLSGGQDSATIAVAVSKLCPDRVLAFTVGERDERRSESRHAAMVCQALGLRHEVYVPSDEDIARGIHDFVLDADQPLGDLAAFAYYLGIAQLPEDCTVVLDGSGNDDYFSVTGEGLRLRYQTRTRIQKYVPDACWPLVTWALSKGPEGLRRLSYYWKLPIEESFVAWEGWSPEELSELFERPISMENTRLWDVMRKGDPSHWRLVLTEVLGGIWEAQAGFAKGVHFAHALGRGIRYPFIDERITTWVHALPMELKLDKAIVRAYMAKHLPAEIVDKRKSGFMFDLNRLFHNPQYQWADELDRAGALQALPGWPARPIRRLLDNHAAAPEETRWQHRLYALCLLAAMLDVSRELADDQKRVH